MTVNLALENLFIVIGCGKWGICKGESFAVTEYRVSILELKCIPG